MKKVCNIVILDSEKESSLFLKSSGLLELSIFPPLHGIKNKGWIYKNLYVVDNSSDIKKGDYILLSATNRIALVEENCGILGYLSKDKVAFLYLPKNIKKVITTTDSNLKLPQLSYEFIEKYIENYNNKNFINYVLLEYNTKNNKIGKIDICKQYWNRDEHLKEVKRMIELYSTTYNGGDINKWIENNLIV